jgi:hypothetical protein
VSSNPGGIGAVQVDPVRDAVVVPA